MSQERSSTTHEHLDEPGTLENQLGAAQDEPGTIENEPGAAQDEPGRLKNKPEAAQDELETLQNKQGAGKDETGTLKSEIGAAGLLANKSVQLRASKRQCIFILDGRALDPAGNVLNPTCSRTLALARESALVI